MDGGDYIYIVIAIVLAIINAVANKKKKEEAKRKAMQPKPDTSMVDPADILQELLTGKATVRPTQDTPEMQTPWNSHDDAYLDPDDAEVEPAKPFLGYGSEDARVRSIEYEQPFVQAKEEDLYPTTEVKPIDVADNSKFTPIDFPGAIEGSIEDYDYTQLSVTNEEEEVPDMIFNHEKALALEAASTTILDEFDPVKAIVYSEVIAPKYV